MKTFCFTVDDNIRFLRELTCGGYEDLFEHPYLAMYRRLHVRFGLKVQLNLFYREAEFDLSRMSDAFRKQWQQASGWLKLSFHSEIENEWPYINAGYDEVYRDCARVQKEILRFAGDASQAETTTIHYCGTTEEGVCALKANGVRGLLGLFEDRTSYSLPEEAAEWIRSGRIFEKDGMAFAPIDMVLNCFSKEELLKKTEGLSDRVHLWVMIHEQYFYPDYPRHQPDFEEKLTAVFRILTEHGYESCFFEELLSHGDT